ncbi:hypothetical protein DA2_0569 [Desulfovibrio sp. A2]|nr:hypothetical protein DA2_0569 [Desulfovibrio sp. A2]
MMRGAPFGAPRLRSAIPPAARLRLRVRVTCAQRVHDGAVRQ